jgi:uncharacterized protein YgfB (UPF0149 family)
MEDLLQYDELAETLTRLGYRQDAAEYHGVLCGALCVNDEVDPTRLLEADAAPADDGAEAQRSLHRLRGQSADAFSGSDMTFAPILPDDEEDLAERVRALSAWCEGFLYGLSTGRPLNMKQCSPELKEILKDFTEFTRAGVTEDEDLELEETAYAELVEYIRVGAQLVYMELHEKPAAPGEAASILH